MRKPLTVTEAGRRGGQAGRGASKRRTPEQYRASLAVAHHAKRIKAARRMLARGLGQQAVIDRFGADILRAALEG